MAIATLAETAFRGDTVLLDITVRKLGALVDLTLSSFWCTAKRSRANADSAAIFQLVGTNVGASTWTQAGSLAGVAQAPGALGSLTSATPGVLHVRIAPAATLGLTPGTDNDLQVDVEYKDQAGDAWTIASGDILFGADVTA